MGKNSDAVRILRKELERRDEAAKKAVTGVAHAR
jgi:hypothetical protein